MRLTKPFTVTLLLLALLLPAASQVNVAASQTAATPLFHPPVAPTIFFADAINGYHVMVTWGDNSDNETVFRIERLNRDGVTWNQVGLLIAANQTRGLATGLSPNGEQTLRVVAIAPSSVGLYEIPSTPVKVTTGNTEPTSPSSGNVGGGGERALVVQGLIGHAGTNEIGALFQTGEMTTSDNALTLLLQDRVYFLNAAGLPQFSLSASRISSPPPAPPQSAVIMAYELGPQGAVFIPLTTQTDRGNPIAIQMAYTDAQIPAGMPESSFYIGIWDGAHWVKLPSSTVDAAANSVTAQIAHFSTYALLAEAQPPTTTPPPPQTTVPPQTTIPPQTTPPPSFATTAPPRITLGGPPLNPPFWDTTAFKVLLITGVLLVAYALFFYFRLRRENDLKKKANRKSHKRRGDAPVLSPAEG